VYRSYSREAVLRQIYVHPRYRGVGYGSKLLKTTIDFARNIGGRAVLLEVLENNVPARMLYEKYGFKQICTKDGVVKYIYEIEQA